MVAENLRVPASAGLVVARADAYYGTNLDTTGQSANDRTALVST
ncbi:MAG TPA: hypothetical protein VHC69_09775 [Polyangiaceae bacterium]|nr:hypothetical protein [Polyangiaceae bacterium]